ncbi:MAG: oligosaccharide flippase family protein [Elusimicrobia bacterium]|nr:oligosaccharide flippase family protein [Elusimicrobiota bacterium]
MRTDLKRFLKHSSIYAVGSVLNRVGAFILLPIYTHAMSVEEYGTLELFYSTKIVMASLLSIGLAHATLRFYFEYDREDDRKKVVGTTLSAVTGIVLPMVVVAAQWSGKASLLLFDTQAYTHALTLLMVIMFLEMTLEVGFAYLRAREYSILFVAASFLQLVIQVACNVYTVGVMKGGVTGVLAGNLMSVLAAWAIVMSVVFKECGIHWDWPKLTRILRYSFPFLFSSLFGVAVAQADRFILKSYGTAGDVGIYSLAVKFGALLQVLFLEPFNQSFGSFRFSIMKQKDTKEILALVLKFTVFALLFLGLAISLFCRPVLRIMTPAEYLEAGHLVPLIILAYSISGLTYFFQTGILYQKKTTYMLYINVLVGLTTLACNFSLIPRYGTYGAVFSILATSLVSVGATYAISNRLYPIAYEQYAILKMYGIAVGLFVLSTLVPQKSLALMAGSIPVLFLLFPVFLYWARCVDRNEISQMGVFLEPVIGKIRGLKK